MPAPESFGARDLPNVTSAALGPEPVIVLRLGSEVLRVALRGATPLRWLVEVPDGVADVLDGYRDADELAAQDGVRNGIMAPFCNRVADGRYVFDGVAHDLLPGAADRLIYHGLVRTLPFTVGEVATHDDGARVTLRCDALADGRHPGYPFAVVVEVTYRLRAGSLEVEIAGCNVGTRAAPFAAGWHPYFRLPGARTTDRLGLALESSAAIRTDPALLPFPGGAAYGPLGPRGAGWAPVGDAVLDACFVGPSGGAGPARSVLSDPETGLRLTVEQERGLTHVFTGDTLERGRRASVAIEPVEAMTDAFNRPDCAEAIRLEPGERRAFRFAVAVSTSG
ncbi:aldose 1-epimerase [Pengzhenrongella sp.]|uniref:aldose 1-epimerase n=1 Tax=Pengzhenrongella sp. TaxID=2888820 RepID=UPI002F95A44E